MLYRRGAITSNIEQKSQIVIIGQTSESLIVLGPTICKRALSVTISKHRELKFFSRPYQQEFAHIPMPIVLAIGWIALLFGLASSFLFKLLPLCNSLIVFYTVVAGICWLALTKRFVISSKQYELVMDAYQISYFVSDNNGNTCMSRQIFFKELISAEYYHQQNNSRLALQSKSKEMEIPLWIFGLEGENWILEHIRRNGIQTIEISSNAVYGDYL